MLLLFVLDHHHLQLSTGLNRNKNAIGTEIPGPPPAFGFAWTSSYALKGVKNPKEVTWKTIKSLEKGNAVQ